MALLRDLRRHVGPRMTVLWDGGSIHRGPVVAAFLARHPGIRIERLPPYAPELNAEEGVWAHMKGHTLANHGRLDVDGLMNLVGDEFNALRQEQDLLRSFVRGAGLPIRLPATRTL